MEENVLKVYRSIGMATLRPYLCIQSDNNITGETTDIGYTDKFSFIGEWYDCQASLTRRFFVFYYPSDNTIEMLDIKTRKTFIRRIKVKGVSLDQFYIGCTLLILGRLIKIVDFATQDTRNQLQKTMQSSFLLIKPMPFATIGKVLTHLHKHNLRFSKMKQARISMDDAKFIYRYMTGDPSYPFQLEYLGGSMIIAGEIVGTDVVATTLKTIGDDDPSKAEPGTVRALLGFDSIKNCVFTSQTPEHALQDLEYFFPPPETKTSRLRLTATLSNCTLCIIKPHAIREGKLGLALEAIDEGGFEITALNMLMVENNNAAEFYEVYKGIVPEYQGMVEELASGPCVAMEIVIAKEKTKNSALEFRKLVGPVDPDIARLLRPHTIRAKIGNTKVQNGIHCSDLPEDGLLEVEYFFKILELCY